MINIRIINENTDKVINKNAQYFVFILLIGYFINW